MKLQILDCKGLLDVTTSMHSAFWGKPLPLRIINDDLELTIKERNLEPDSVAFCSIFTSLWVLASSDVADTLRGDAGTLLITIWNGDIGSQNLSSCLSRVWFTDFVHLSIYFAAGTSFVTLYSLHLQGSLEGDITFGISTRSFAARHSLQCTCLISRSL